MDRTDPRQIFPNVVSPSRAVAGVAARVLVVEASRFNAVQETGPPIAGTSKAIIRADLRLVRASPKKFSCKRADRHPVLSLVIHPSRPVVKPEATTTDLPDQQRPPPRKHLSRRNMAVAVAQRFCIARPPSPLPRTRPKVQQWPVSPKTTPIVDRKIGVDGRRLRPRHKVGETARHLVRRALVSCK